MLQLTAAHGIPNANGNGGENKQDECAPKTHLRFALLSLRKALVREKFSTTAEQQQRIQAIGPGLLILNSSLLLQLLAKSMGDAGLHNHSKFGP